MRLHQVLRRFAKMPFFTGVAVFTLAIGIGANSAIFSVIEGVLLKPLPFPQPDDLIVVDHNAVGINLPHAGAAPFLYFTYREEGRSFEDVGMWTSGLMSVTGLAQPEEVRTLVVTDGVLPLLRVQPMLGRVFSKADDSPGGADTVVLTAGFWRSKFGADPSILGRPLMLDSKPRAIIGVLPDSFRFLDVKAAVLVPLQLDRSKTFLGNFSFTAIGRLKPGVTIAAAQTDAARLVPVAIGRYPPFPGGNAKMFEEARITPAFRSLKTDLVGDLSRVLWVLMGTIGMVLLIACANVANLLLVRAESRQQELAIRAALGAGSGRIARELLVESVTLGVLGGVAGLALAFGALKLLVALGPDNIPRLDDIHIDAWVLLFTLALSVVAGLLFGVIPVFKYAGPQLSNALRGAGGRTASAGRERHRARNILVVAQVALALVLLVGSGLMIRTFQALRNVQPGFTRAEELQTFRLSIPRSQVDKPEAVARMHQAIMDKVAALPGVSSVALTTIVPMTGQGWHDPLYAEDHAYTESQVPPIIEFKFVTPGYLKTMGTALVAGRDFTWEDLYERRAVMMVSENKARELWGRPGTALGKRARPYPNGMWREVVGVVADSRDDGVDKKAPSIAYWPMLTTDFTTDEAMVQRGLSYLVRSTRAGTPGLVAELGPAVWSVNPNLPLARMRTMRDVYDASLARTSFTLVMLGIAGGMALLLGVAGLYGVISYSVTQRAREIGIRIALGARRQEVTRMFVGHGLTLAAVGVGVGAVVALGLMRLMRTLLFEVSPLDPATYGAVALMLVTAAVLASYVPALRAAAVDPARALRAE